MENQVDGLWVVTVGHYTSPTDYAVSVMTVGELVGYGMDAFAAGKRLENTVMHIGTDEALARRIAYYLQGLRNSTIETLDRASFDGL